MSAPSAGVAERLRPDELGLLALRVVAVVAVIVGVPHFPNAAAQRFVEIAHAPGCRGATARWSTPSATGS